jgi:hypothetical protein
MTEATTVPKRLREKYLESRRRWIRWRRRALKAEQQAADLVSRAAEERQVLQSRVLALSRLAAMERAEAHERVIRVLEQLRDQQTWEGYCHE